MVAQHLAIFFGKLLNMMLQFEDAHTIKAAQPASRKAIWELVVHISLANWKYEYYF